MAKKTWNNPIDKNVDWGGDESTGGLPVSGEMVQKFIKDSLNGKAGLFHYDTTNNRYLVFSDSEARDEYLLDPTKTELIIGTFDAPFNYLAEINLTSNAYNAVFLGSTGNYIDFTFDVKNKQGVSTGENVNITYTFIRNSVKRIVRETRKFGDSVHFCVDDYIDEGTNTIIVGITGQSTLAATTASVTYQVVNLQLTDETDISNVYNLSNGPQTAEVSFTISGYGTKIMEWYLDGVQLEYVKAEDEVVDVSVTRTKFITLLNLQQGRHSLQMRAYTLINGERFYTDTLYRDLMVYTGADSNLIIGAAVTIPRAYGVLGASDGLAIYDMVQYIPYTLRFATYSPSNAANTEVSVIVDGESKGTIGSVNGIENEFSLVSNTSGTKSLVLQAGDVSYEIGLVVADTTMDLEEITNALAFDFNALGKSNNSSDKDSWSYGEYTGTFSGFNWNATSGWSNDRLEINAGASFAVNYAPLSGTPTSLGKTIEIEWSTKNVINDDAIICDLRGSDGTGILITATKVSLTSRGGVVIETEYKSNENVRVGFVINRSSGSTNQRLSFIYSNGIVSRCEAWAITESYSSDAEIAFTATEEAEISLKAIRVYDSALTSDQMLNNFILYRDSISDMMSVYDRNDVYEEGTTTFSPEKMSSRLPVMIVTGDIPTLENTSDKDTQIVVDIEYTNMQDPTRNFKMVGAAMRPQGTSSMGYPKKNFRIYTQKVDSTKVYDHEGKLIEDKLYAFKQGSQPVNCWCLKADYAESSGTHNTGIARLWNEAFKEAQVTYSFGDGDPRNINSETVLRTHAQQIATDSGYPYDVRTAIDGFPILLFYRPSANDDLIFIGKYNFNNDKSTESVFGFTFPEGVGMDEWIANYGSTMQCWEILNNGNDLALFTTVEGFDSGWSKAFEGRYPDKNTNVADLKTFCTWMSSVSDANFATEKWEHLDVYKMAAYWVYLMRHAGADQFVKNAMFTSEDGVKWYFILYDNDTVNGLINTGRLGIKPTDDRQTVDASGAYVFAGHDSRLWNMLEADDEFLAIAAAVDNALYSAGISYVNAINIFDNEQGDKWVERVYNQDAQYKYIGTFVESGVNNLFMLQGKRDLHRRWWLAKRYSIFDAKYITGPYKSSSVEIKCNETAAGQKFTITAGYPLEYGYGINNIPRESGVSLDIGESYTFVTQEEITLGDPIRIYGSPNIAELDFSEMGSRLTKVDVSGCYDDALGTMLKRLVIGKSGVTNNAVFEFSGLPRATKLEYLDVQGIKGITSLDLSNQPNFKTLIATGSNISSVQFAKGALVERIEIPATMTSLHLEQLPYLTYDNIISESNFINITDINIKGCPNVSNSFEWVHDWFSSKTEGDQNCSLVMDNINWTNVNPEQFLTVLDIKKNGGILNLKGRVSLPTATVETVEAIRDIFGDTAFLPTSEFFVEIPESLILEGPSRVVNGKSGTFVATPIPVAVSSPTYAMIVNGEEMNSIAGVATLDANTGVLSVNADLAADTSVVVRAKFLGRDNTYIYSNEVTVAVEIEVRPTSININGDASVYYKDDEHTYTLGITPNNVNVGYTVAWSLSDTDNLNIISQDNASCVIKVLNELTGSGRKYTLTAVLTAFDGADVLTASKDITLEQVVRPTSLVFDDSNGEIQFVGNYTYVATPNITPINVDVTYGTPTLSGTAVSQGKVSLVSASNGTIVIAVSAETTSELYFTIKQTATVGGNGATIEGVRQATLKNVIRPTSMSISGKEQIAAGSHTFNAVLSPSTVNVEMTYEWSYSGSSNVSIQSTDGASCVLFANEPTEEEAFTLSCTATSVDGKTTVTATFSGTVILKPNYITATYRVSSTTSATKLLYASYSLYNVTYMEIDGVEVVPVKTYTFATTGEHTVKMSIENMYRAFYQCSNLVSADFSEFNGAKYPTWSETFYNCTRLTSVTIPDSITSLGDYCFYQCSSLTSIIIPDSVTSLGRTCFYQCSSLTSVTIPDSVTSWGDSCFGSCTSLTSVTISSGVTSLGDNCFTNCTSLTSVTIPDSVTSLGRYCFNMCPSLTSITISDSVTSLGNACFGYCGSLNITVDDGNLNYSSIDGVLFDKRGTTLVTYAKDVIQPTYTIPDSVTSLGDYCFRGCTHLTSVTIPDSVTSLGDNCIYGCTSLTSIIIPDSVTSLGEACFSTCRALTSITIPDSVTSLGRFCFYDCRALTSITIPDSITSLGDYCFYQCSSLTSIIIPDSVTSWGDYCFYDCSSLTSVTIPDSITSLGVSCFYGCKMMKSITCYATTAPTVQSNTFGNSTSNYTGRNTYSSGQNMLYVPTGATGYTSSYWGSVLLYSSKCGFTLSATL